VRSGGYDAGLPMSRKLFTLCAVASLLLGVAVCAVWVRSYWRLDVLEFERPSGRVAVVSSAGRLGYAREQVRAGELPAEPSTLRYHSDPPENLPAEVAPAWPADFDLLGVVVLFRPTSSADHLMLLVPHWLATLALAALPAVAATRIYRRRRDARRTAAGGCPACGYDCRATPARCPECGAASKSRT
jgi:hypothetical protein